ncbi:MAG: 4Fe-4S binding protein, partial [Eggerthellaceae bacterium]|nr:4Fe-4S binding protein [Eggerthellaceae bacterium]
VTGAAPTWHVAIGLVLAVVFGLMFGKAFCSWICPTPWVQRIFGKKTANPEAEAKEAEAKADAADSPAPILHESSSDGALAPSGGKRDRVKFDTRHGVLLGALLSTAIFGFPVFCLICPVGLTIATFIAVWHAFQFSEVTWGLLVFPAIVILEVVVLKRWCHTLCPLGALYSLLARGNKTFVPKVNTGNCLRTKGADCHVCVDACPEELDPHTGKIPECTKCGICVEHCPSRAIDFVSLLKSK